jgi:DNA-binding beta-propeller fold protein YncE
VWVADSGNGRIQVWDTGGQFVRSIPVPEWSGPNVYGDVALSNDGKALYASSPKTNTILVFSIDGARLSPLEVTPPDTLDQPAAIAVAPDGRLYVVDFGAARVSAVTPAAH